MDIYNAEFIKRLKIFVSKVDWIIPYEFYYHAEQDMDENRQYLPPTTVMTDGIIFGDSRAAGGQWETNIRFLKPENENMKLINKSIGGTTITDASQPPSIQVLIGFNPKFYIQASGGNDLGAGTSYKKIMGDAFKIMYNLRKYNPGSKLFIHCVLPIIKHGSATNKNVIELNNLLKLACQVMELDFIDFFNDFYDPATGWCKLEYLNLNEVPEWLWKKYTPVHFSEAGYQKWYELLNNYLAKFH